MEKITTFLKQSVGHSLQSVEGLFYMAPGESALSMDQILELRIVLGPHHLRIKGSGDGETLLIDANELCPGSLGELGDLCRADLTRGPEFSRCVECALLRAMLVTSYEGTISIGCFLEFTSGSILICNWGDDLKVWNEIPESLFEIEGIRIEPV